ncbi:MAG: T9SS type A sorting domain-containing protein [bacterium]|nr:T9SS type A sorting domain-containing protein [bacterium]
MKNLIILFLASLFVVFPRNVSAQLDAIDTITIGPKESGLIPWGIAVNSSTKHIYVTNWQSNNVSVIDGDNNSVITTIPVGDQPTSIAVNENTNKIYVANENTGTVSVIDGNTNTVIKSIPVGGMPTEVAVNPNNNRIYVGHYSEDFINIIDGATDSVIAVDSLQYGAHSIAINLITNVVYALGYNLYIIDGTTNAVIDTIFAVGGESTEVVVDATSNYIYVSGGEYNPKVYVINAITNTLVDSIPVCESPRYMAVNPVTNRIYVAQENVYYPDSVNEFTVIDGATNTVITNMTLDSYWLESVAIDITTNKIYVANCSNNQVDVIDGATNNKERPISLGVFPYDICVAPVNNKIYFTTLYSDNLCIIEDDSLKTSLYAPWLGRGLSGVDYNPLTNHVYVANSHSPTIPVIDGDNDSIIKTITNSYGWATDVCVNTSTNRIYFSNAAGAIIVIDGATDSCTDSILTNSWDLGEICVNPRTNYIYALEQEGTIYAVNGTSKVVTNEIEIPEEVSGIAVNPITGYVYVTSNENNNLYVIENVTHSIEKVVTVGMYPNGIGIDSLLNHIYVCGGDGTISVINGITNSVITTVNIGAGLRGIWVNSSTHILYVGCYDGKVLELKDNIGIEENADFGLRIAELKILKNPFIGSTTINYILPTKTKVYLKVFDISGREVRKLVDGIQKAGSYNLELNMQNLTGGIYFVKLTSGEQTVTSKVIVLK